MLNYYYDGSFDGLLTVIYMAYEDRKSKALRVSSETEQLILEFDDIHIMTDFSKARRVEKNICEKLSQDFLNKMRTCFLSCDKNKDTIIVHTVYKALKQGEEILNSLDEHAFRMNRLIKQVLSERHKYLGVLRFREMKDGTMFATIEPKNAAGIQRDFSFIEKQRGMFSYSGLTAQQVEALKADHGIYAVSSGRICVAALNQKNIEHVAKAIAQVLKQGT